MDPLHVLVVDDERGMRMGVARALRQFTVSLPNAEEDVRFSVAQAATGQEALDMIGARQPEILLLDYKLPDFTGLDVLQQLGAASDDMLTIMITAFASLETAIAATKRGAYDFLAKPFTPEELRGTVRKAVKHVLLQRQARQLAEEKHQVRFQFISVLAHELKAPLGAIEGYLRIISGRTAGNDLATYDHMLDRSLIRLEGMRKLILDLLDMTRIESGKKQRELAPVDIAAMANESVETFSPQAVAQEVTMQLHTSGPVVITADRGEIEIILNNLVSNAIKYNRQGGHVDITVAAEHDTVKLTVADTGIGMSQEEAGKLFQEFTRIKNSKTRHILGTGLGLSILKKLVLLYGGEVTVASEPERGTTFTVTLKETEGGRADAAA
jgi:two-component system, sensor histidine kinase and response regulator